MEQRAPATVASPAEIEAGTPDLLRHTADVAIAFRSSLAGRRVGAVPGLTAESLRASLGAPLSELGEDPRAVIDALVAGVEPGLVAMGSPRYFGFVIGGSVPAALAADWLTSTWEQNTGLYLATPAAAVVEEIAGAWLLDLFGLPPESSVGFTTGATMAHFTALAAARHAVLRQAGWDVEEDGLIGAPTIHVIVGADVHVSMVNALRMVGLGRRRAIRVASDDEGRMRPAELRRTLADLPAGPTIVCAQAGEVNTGAFDPLDAIADVLEARSGAWLHVDGAFGLWAAAVPGMRTRLAGNERADSWTTDAHKWLNVPYDSGLVFIRDVAAHLAAMGVAAAYLPPAPGAERDPFDYVPELSRRARGFAVYAALRSLGRAGIAEMVGRTCTVARRMADRLAAVPGGEVLNEVVLNQLLVRFDDDDELTRDVARRVQDEGTAWLGGTTFHGRAAIRISVSNWATTEADGDRSVDAIVRSLEAARAARTG
ncbi:MAG: pyridoxal-dependent decarboxylase [Chloroflexota bacterium]|nr:pyridoxal-dependent decarboxylase [Chloroflexota bacterium]